MKLRIRFKRLGHLYVLIQVRKPYWLRWKTLYYKSKYEENVRPVRVYLDTAKQIVEKYVKGKTLEEVEENYIVKR